MKKCQTRSIPDPYRPPHSLSLVYFQSLAQCLAQADPQKFNNSINPLTLALREIKKAALCIKVRTTEFVLFLYAIFNTRRECQIYREDKGKKSPSDRDHKDCVSRTLHLSKSRTPSQPGECG